MGKLSNLVAKNFDSDSLNLFMVIVIKTSRQK